MRTWLSWAVVLAVVGCHSGLGDVCDEGTPCPEGLVCSIPRGNAEQPKGICDYPLKAQGAPCSQAAECEAALTCSTHFSPNTRYGQCVPKRGAGEACFQDRDCQGRCEGESGTALDGTCAG